MMNVPIMRALPFVQSIQLSDVEYPLCSETTARQRA